MRRFILALILATGTATVAQAAVVEIKSRGIQVRSILLTPDGKAKGAVILLVGDNGRLDITPDGTITKLGLNQLTRTRATYRKAGMIVLLPDLAPDLKIGENGVVSGYRVAAPHAEDVGNMVKFLRKRTNKPVVVIGTSRGSIGAANAVSRLSGGVRPDAEVFSSGFWHVGPVFNDINIWEAADNGKATRLNIPTLAVWHVDDQCEFTSPSDMPAFKKWYQKNGLKLSQKSFSGGKPPESGPCDGLSQHGFWGLDGKVVKATVSWISGFH